MCQSGQGILFVALQEIVWGEAYSGCRGRPCASPHARQGIHPQKASMHIGPYGPSGWHRACPYTGGITHTKFRSPLFVKERRQGRCPAADSLEGRGFEILILRRTNSWQAKRHPAGCRAANPLERRYLGGRITNPTERDYKSDRTRDGLRTRVIDSP